MEIEILIVALSSMGAVFGAMMVLRSSPTVFDRRRTWMTAGVILFSWWFSVCVAAGLGWFQATHGSVFPKIVIGWIPALVGFAAWAAFPSVKKRTDLLSAEALVGFQTFRLVGVAMLWSTAFGKLPAIFAMPAGIGGLLVGATAPWIARALARHATDSVKWAARWNALGFADILVAMVLGGLTGPGPNQLLSLDFPSVNSTSFPLAITPAFLVPLALLGHFLLWRTLRRRSTAELNRSANCHA
ncbi:MAG: hypothetical protein RL173_1291 [Fibrobacterota bacterium]